MQRQERGLPLNLSKEHGFFAVIILLAHGFAGTKLTSAETDQSEFYLALTEKAFSPSLQSIVSSGISRVGCSSICMAKPNCDAYNFERPSTAGANATCQLVEMGLSTIALNATAGSESWLKNTYASSGLVRARLLPDRKVYAVINNKPPSSRKFASAKTHCSELGARVAGPTSIHKFNAFTAAMVDLKNTDVYMGMQDNAIKGLFVDDKGNSYPWSLNYRGQGENCLVARDDTVADVPAVWMIGDKSCNDVGPYVCEFPRPQSLQDIGCFEIPPKPEGAIYQNWDGVSFPFAVGANVSSVCQPGEHFHTGISVYATTCDADGYWIRPNLTVPFCTGTLGYLSNGTNCFKLLQEATVFPSSAQARCQQMGGNVLAFTLTRGAIFKSLLFPEGSTAAEAKAIAGYRYNGTEASWKDAQGNSMPLETWNSNGFNGGPAKNYAFVRYSSPSSEGVAYADGDDEGPARNDTAQLICVFDNC